MEHVSKNLPTPSALTPPQNAGSNSQSKQQQTFRMRQLGSLINQGFQIFNVYGKPPEAVSTIIQGFAMVLEPYQTDDITAAFKRWMTTQSTMPTPAQIREICIEILRDKREAGKGFAGRAEWTQVIRDYDTDEVLGEHPSGRHLSPIEIEKQYGNNTRTAMKRGQ